MGRNRLDELNVEPFRKVFLKYTRAAFKLLPRMDHPCILDIGCGTGLPTLELARLSNGDIFAIDPDAIDLEDLKSKVSQLGLTHRIKILNSRITSTGLPDETFNLLWDEGTLHLVDLRKSLKECHRLLKPDGFLVMAETNSWMKNKFKILNHQGFALWDQFPWPAGCWWSEYYQPLEEKVKEIRRLYPDSKNIDRSNQLRGEIEMVKRNPRKFDCSFYIFKKNRT